MQTVKEAPLTLPVNALLVQVFSAVPSAPIYLDAPGGAGCFSPGGHVDGVAEEAEASAEVPHDPRHGGAAVDAWRYMDWVEV